MVSSSDSEPYLSCGIMIDSQSQEWYKRLSKILKILKGATYTIDAEKGTGIVCGRGNSMIFLKKLKDSGLEVAWIKTGNPNAAAYGSNGYRETDPYPYQFGYHYNNPYVPNPPHLQPYGYWSTRHY